MIKDDLSLATEACTCTCSAGQGSGRAAVWSGGSQNHGAVREVGAACCKSPCHAAYPGHQVCIHPAVLDGSCQHGACTPQVLGRLGAEQARAVP